MLGRDPFVTVGKCDIHPTATMCWGAIVGKQFRPLMNVPPLKVESQTIIGPNAYVGYHSVVGAGSVIGARSVLDDFTVIECEVMIGEGTLAIYRAQVCNEAQVGNDCVIGGFVAERVVVGNRSRVFGKIVHSHHDPTLGWDEPGSEEGSATLGEGVFIGFDAILAGSLTVGTGAYVCSGAIVTRDIPAGYIAHGINKFIHPSKWSGRLAQSAFFGCLDKDATLNSEQ